MSESEVDRREIERTFERNLRDEEVSSLERSLPRSDTLADRLGLGTHYGSIEAAEEKRFPWLKARRARRRRR